ncbi:ADP-heptose:LPS heptosyltransferase [Thermosporothrix hazakensis]|jgi:ADP-heptose:LPS heptosyltransferase|uniref:ADP-heptose:LPS heptosyltransferase n=2 Tax=Thermosporothrix TaxID=768650 RepID=A0A326U1A9_THEHA|nr:glycosyltransferase family 9 protein [Thermosporothrix hazakensis]PZW24678.1 ADP-heptose:LPS heptosyltransferase [Thermosporothrix hazakensis]BBH90339.1 glycoside hydrolase [Thermosporothrix sp. COM3]GCE48375.1 glycoside hydrolase [Thermosporothrix hazakensis]
MRILLVRPGAIGDTLLTLPVIAALKAYHPNTTIHFVGRADVLPLFHASGLVEETSDYEALQWSALFASPETARRLLSPQFAGYDLAICWLRDSEGTIARNLTASGIQEVITAPGRPPADTVIHVAEYLAQTAGVMLAPDFQLTLPQRPSGQETIAIHPGSGGPQKCWPVPCFAEVIQHLEQKRQPTLLLAGPAEAQRLQELRHLLTPAPAFLTELISAPLLDVAYALTSCRAYLGNDTGITHLAALLGIPTLALFQASDPRLWRPLGQKVHIITISHQGVGNMSTQSILSLLDSFSS